eukprot:765502-Hanusia_phi.AAC.1
MAARTPLRRQVDNLLGDETEIEPVIIDEAKEPGRKKQAIPSTWQGYRYSTRGRPSALPSFVGPRLEDADALDLEGLAEVRLQQRSFVRVQPDL